jgi:effector-binding domain-containing protein
VQYTVQVKQVSEQPIAVVRERATMANVPAMKPAHAAIHQWVRENGRKLAGPSWEVYGDWSDDPAKLRTDIFCLLS